MKKKFKVIGIIFLVVLILGGLIGYNFWGKLDKANSAQENSKFIIDNLDNEKVYNEFPEKYFQKDLLKNTLVKMKQNCDWKNRNGKFVDFYSMKNIGGIDQTAFIYEYYLKCDSLRFILIYNMDKNKPELFRLDIEPIEVKNSMIIFPEKQLKK